MVEYDLINYLKADSALDTLLGVSGSDSKIYPSIPDPEPSLPYVLYYWGVGDQTDEILDEDRIQLTIRASTKQSATDVRDRIKILLDKLDEIQDTIFTTSSTVYHVYYCRFTGGDSSWDSDTSVFTEVMFFNIKYKTKI